MNIKALAAVGKLAGVEKFLAAAGLAVGAICAAQAGYYPPTTVEPVMDGAFTSPQEYAQAFKVRDQLNVGWFYNEYSTNWHSSNSITFFKMHAFDDPGYGQLDLYDLNMFEFTYSNVVITTWVFLAGDEYPTNDFLWLNQVGLTNYTVLDDDDGFLVRLNHDPSTDKRWKPGLPQPGDPGWDFANYYGVFARGGFNNSAYTNGYSSVQDPRELYEWSITIFTNGHVIPGLPPSPICWETNEVKYVQPPQLTNGFDFLATGNLVLADDFICTTNGYISDIHLWGSWQSDLVDTNAVFWLGIYDDVPGPPSHPGNLLWQQWFGPSDYAHGLWGVGLEAFYDPGTATDLGPESQVYYYCFYPTNAYEQTGSIVQPVTYWLAVFVAPSASPGANFGWKSAVEQHNDAAVWTWSASPPPAGGWMPLENPNTLFPVDLAFKITTTPNPVPPPGRPPGDPWPPPPICDPYWEKITVFTQVDDWKPEMGGFGTYGGIGWVPEQVWVLMDPYGWMHPFIPEVPIGPGGLDTNAAVVITAPTVTCSSLTFFNPSNYLRFDDSLATPGRTLYSTEMIGLDISGGTLPDGMMLHEQPTIKSRGYAVTDPGTNGYQIESIFDVYTELSTDYGMSWMQHTNAPFRLNLTGGAPLNQFPTNTLPPLAGHYMSPPESPGCYEQGIIIKNMIYYGFSESFVPPPPGYDQVEHFSSQVIMDVSTNGGGSFFTVMAPANLTVLVTNVTVGVAGGTISIVLSNSLYCPVVGVNSTNNYTLSGPGKLSGSGVLIKQGPGMLTLNTNNNYTGGTIVSEGTLAIANSSSLGSGPLELSQGTTFRSANANSKTVANRLTISGDITLGAAGSGVVTFSGAQADVGTVSKTLTIPSGTSATINSAITNTGGMTKAGLGALVLGGRNTYTGPTTVSSGTLALSGSGSVSNSSPVTVLSLLDASGRSDKTCWVATGQTLAGTGSVRASNVVVCAGATVAPGSNSIGTLTVSSNLSFLAGSVAQMEIDRAHGTNDVLRSTNTTGRIAYAGTLNVTNISTTPLAAGDSFKLFDAATYAGTFDCIIPGTPGPGMRWDTSSLAINGTLKASAPIPVVTSIALVPALPHGYNIVLTATNGTPGSSCQILVCTNVAAPLSDWQSLPCPPIDDNGNLCFTNAVDPNTAQLFYRLRGP